MCWPVVQCGVEEIYDLFVCHYCNLKSILSEKFADVFFYVFSLSRWLFEYAEAIVAVKAYCLAVLNIVVRPTCNKPPVHRFRPHRNFPSSHRIHCRRRLCFSKVCVCSIVYYAPDTFCWALLWIGWRVSQRDVHYLHYASLTARSLSTLVTPQCNPTMCNRTSCAQVHELP